MGGQERRVRGYEDLKSSFEHVTRLRTAIAIIAMFCGVCSLLIGLWMMYLGLAPNEGAELDVGTAKATGFGAVVMLTGLGWGWIAQKVASLQAQLVVADSPGGGGFGQVVGMLPFKPTALEHAAALRDLRRPDELEDIKE